MKVVGDRILVKPVEVAEEKRGSLYMPSNAKKIGTEGEVVSLGEGRVWNEKLVPFNVKIGDKILFESGAEIEVGGEKFFVITEAMILVVL